MLSKTLKSARRCLGATTLAAVTMFCGVDVARAESNWPSGPVNMVMHTAAGGSADVFIRTLAKTLEPEIGQKVIVINAPGGGGAAQMTRVLSAKPDGLTLGVNTLSHFTSMLTNLKGTYAIDDFSWIASTQEDAILLFVKSGSDMKNLNDLVALAKANNGQVNVGGFGPAGSMQSIGITMLEKAAGVKFNWIAFNSTPDIVAALLGGHIDVGVSNLGAVSSFFDASRLVGLGVLGEERLTGLPDVPTFGEQGYQVDTSWLQVRGVFGPADIPKQTQQKIADAIHKAMRSEEYQNYARNAGVVDSWMGPKEYTDFVKRVTDIAQTQLKAAGYIQ
ncbi:tripartite tricarboxylate transporter substrate binding protein [Pseudomonas sp. NFACC39-1]|uniref:tripartite tricarboxylate transporter substrate binding protein n=1 Tax=Pseudomonas sp. NFACC39-1 TaxID=1566195 RepID=UPI0008C53243|nr:tripartite tricarboxylate transporter substrate binding protein [Pseudomonas sp. NFACC39-1]SEO02486.1 Tripartite-type tricarboxylate transporter, receptor component TctC [Pseudomonas sp. NFACC39-1]